MKPTTVCLVIASLLVAGCTDDDSPFEPGAVIDFEIIVPAVLQAKGLVDVETHILLARGVEYPLEVTFEKANTGAPFFVEGTQTIQSSATSRVSIRIPLLEDPRIRVTVRESSAQGLTVSKSVQVDVLDFP
jgi:hypothetical protein